MKGRPPICVFKVALQGNPKIWRTVALQASQTLDDLHAIIYDAFDRYDEHLYSFYFPQPCTKGRARLRTATEYAHPYCEEEDFGSDKPVTSAAKTTLASLTLRTKQKFLYLFDFGDSWWHEITVEQVDSPAERGRYPRILERHGASPPQYPDLEEEE